MKRIGLVLLVAIGLGIWLGPVNGQQPDPLSGSYVPGEIIVQFAQGVSSTRRAALMAARGATIMRHFQELDLSHVRIPPGRSVEAALAELRGNPEVVFAQPNYVYRAISTSAPPNDPQWLDGSLWGMEKIAAQQAWQAYGGGNGSVIVADIDTGVMYTHPDLAANMWHNPGEIPGNGIDDDVNGYVDDVFGIDAFNHDSNPMDDQYHGTHTSGTIAAVGNNSTGVVGVNWNAKILACKFLNSAGNGTDAGAIECFNYIRALRLRGENIRVSSNSWGGTRTGQIDLALKNAIDAAGSVGILNVFAAGNGGTNTDSSPFDPASFSSSSIVSVAASDQNDQRASFSNYGATAVDLAAPGVSILSTITGPAYGLLSGTSMATPHVAGVAALVSSLDPTLSVDGLKVALMQNVDVLPQWAGQVVSGGRLNAFRTASAVVPVNQPPTVALTSPSGGTSFTPGAPIALAATASDNGSVASVAFYADGALVNTDTTSPYAFNWSSAVLGSHTLTAVATDNIGLTTTSAPVGISVASAGGGTSAAFVGFDPTTQGEWRTLYGSQGFVIVNDSTSLPAYATVIPSGHNSWTWSDTTTQLRALRRSGPGRIAATWYSGTAFDIAIGLTDGQPHKVALYCLDEDARGRSQKFEVFDAASNALLDTRTLGNFVNGQYVVWTLTGNVRIHVTMLAGTNAVVSGVFLGAAGAPVNQPPTVALTSPSPGASFTPGAAIALAANASDDGSVANVAFYADGALVNTDTTSPYAFNWSTTVLGSHTLTAVATDNIGLATTSAPIGISVASAGGGTSAAFVGFDPTTQGEWPTLYGSQGFVIVNDSTSLPAYATVIPSGHNSWTWSDTTTQLRALRRSGPGRIAATWYSGTAFDIAIGLTDGQPHKVALYCLDEDARGRSQKFEVFDAASNALLDTRTLGNFVNGQYVVWTLTGNVRIHVTMLAGTNAVVSGVFLGAAGAPVNQPPTVALTSPSPGASFTPGAAIALAANASDDGSVANVAFYADGALVNTDTTSPYAFNWSTTVLGSHTLTAVATDNIGLATTSAPIGISVASAGGGTSAAFVGFDPTTQGEWPTLYGSQGFVIVNDSTSLPAYATVIPSGHNSWTWSDTTTQLRALRRSGPGRIAATWYSGTAFDIAIGLTDGQPHKVALYCLDEDARGRSQKFEVFDAASNALLDTRTLGNFVNGQYVVWTLTGNVRIHVTMLAGTNAVVSGVFLGAAGAPVNQPPTVAPSTMTLRADFVGTLGGGGNASSPIVAGSQLLLLNQTGLLYRWNGSAPQQILTTASPPVGLSPFGSEALLNVAANSAGTSVFAMFTSSTTPAGAPQYVSPRPGADAWQVLYRYTFNGTALSNPQAIVSLQVRSDGHTGGGMVVLDTGAVLFATGDNGDAGEDGRQYAQDPSTHLSKILRIDPATGTVTVLASGVRNVQRLFLNPNSGDPRLEFVDLGGAIAEEFNSVRLADLLASTQNFGWGRNAGDGLAREGTFYIDSAGAATGVAPTPEAGFRQPVAQFGREGALLVGVTGVVSSAVSFSNITALFGDLPSGNVLAVTGAPGTPNQTVFHVNLVDSALSPVTLSALAGGRPDPRFFLFPDGTAGVLLERTGSFYRLTQINQ